MTGAGKWVTTFLSSKGEGNFFIELPLSRIGLNPHPAPVGVKCPDHPGWPLVWHVVDGEATDDGFCRRGQHVVLSERMKQQRKPRPSRPVLPTAPPPRDGNRSIKDSIARCDDCGEAVWRVGAFWKHDFNEDFDWRPWIIDISAMPETCNTPTRKRNWVREQPYRLGLACIDFQAGVYHFAQDRPKATPRSKVMFQPHWCEQKERRFYDGNHQHRTEIAERVRVQTG